MPKDRDNFKISNFTALILWVDIETKVLYFQERKKISELSDWLLAQNFEVVLAVRVVVAGGSIFAIVHQEV